MIIYIEKWRDTMKTIKVYFYSLILILIFVGCNADNPENEDLPETTDSTAEEVQDGSQDNPQDDQENDSNDEIPVDSQDETTPDIEEDEEALDNEEMGTVLLN
jgi:PBP1b-binding outer membrane lipoprotein LpoB